MWIKYILYILEILINKNVIMNSLLQAREREIGIKIYKGGMKW